MPDRFGLTSLFTGVNHGLFIAPPGNMLGPRRRAHHEMLWIQRGSAQFNLDGTRTHAPAGNLVLLPPARREFCRWDRHETSQIAFIQFTFDGLPSDWPALAQWPRLRAIGNTGVDAALFQFIQTHAPQQDVAAPNPTLARAMETLLSAHLLGPTDVRPPVAPMPSDPVYRALVWIAEMMQSDPSLPVALQDLADASGVSPKHLCRLFEKSIQSSPVEAVWVFRLTHSLMMLRDPYRKIAEIAQALGFSHAFHYSRRFRAYFGVPPSEMREKLLTGFAPTLPPWPFM